jgi:hypothetical protein
MGMVDPITGTSHPFLWVGIKFCNPLIAPRLKFRIILQSPFYVDAYPHAILVHTFVPLVSVSFRVSVFLQPMVYGYTRNHSEQLVFKL